LLRARKNYWMQQNYNTQGCALVTPSSAAAISARRGFRP
jgi:hypothetical protein